MPKTPNTPAYTLVTTKLLFTTTIIILTLTVLFVWLFGLGRHRTLFENSFISTWILTTILFLFLFVGLYKGFKLRNNLSIEIKKPKIDWFSLDYSWIDLPDTDLEGILLFIILIPVFIVLIVNLAVVFWFILLIFLAILYWVFYRAIKFCFRFSPKCKHNTALSLWYGFLFTTFYSIWFYAIILGVHYYK